MPPDQTPDSSMSSVEERPLVETLTGTPVPSVLPVRVPSQLFSASPRARRVRRPTDVTLLLVAFGLLLGTAVVVDGAGTGLLDAVDDVLHQLPSILTPIWQVLHDLVLASAAIVVVAAAVRRQWAMVRDLIIAIVLAVVSAALTGRLATGSWPAWSGWSDGTTVGADTTEFPLLALAIAVVVLSVASPHLTRPFRYAGRWVVALGTLGFAALPPGSVVGALGAVALGWLVAAAVHLWFGSPGGLPSLERVRIGLAGLGVVAEPIELETSGGVAVVHARGTDGADLEVKVYGRDAWDGQFLVSLWRFLWYRDGGRTLAVSRLQQVEHEAFVTLLAERGGVAVAGVVAAGLDAGGDALLVTHRRGRGLDELGDDVGDDDLAEAWTVLGRLHARGLSHGNLDPTRIRLDDEGVHLRDFGGAQVAPDSSAQLMDAAQLLVATAVVVGPDRAVAVAADALGIDGLVEVSSFVQPSALPTALRRAADEAGLEVDDLRDTVASVTAQPARELQRLRRLSLGRLLVVVVLLLASWALVSSLADIGVENILDALASANGLVVLLAFVIGITPRFANAVALSAASPIPVPLGRLTALQFAISFVNLAMPSTAARAAVNIRFFQRSGVEPATAVSVGLLDSVTGFVGQITLLVTILGFGLGTLELDLGGRLSVPALRGLLAILLGVLLVGVLVVVLVAKIRAAIVAAVRRVWRMIGPVLSSPRRFVTLLGANMTAELLFALCMYTVLRAYDQDVGYGDVVVVNLCVALFAGLMPVPGGVGVTEAALTAGFIAIGVDEATAFAAAITYRVVTFYTPPIMGFFAFRWLHRQQYL